MTQHQPIKYKKDEDIGKDRTVYTKDPKSDETEVVELKKGDPISVFRIKYPPKHKFAEGGWKRRETAVVK